MKQCGAKARNIKIEDIFTTSWGGDYTPQMGSASYNKTYPAVHPYEIWNTITNIQTNGEVSVGVQAWGRSEQRRFFGTTEEQYYVSPSQINIYHTTLAYTWRSDSHFKVMTDYNKSSTWYWFSTRISAKKDMNGSGHKFDPNAGGYFSLGIWYDKLLSLTNPETINFGTDIFSSSTSLSQRSRNWGIYPVVDLQLSKTKLGTEGAGLPLDPYVL